jgi:hypothetical protein
MLESSLQREDHYAGKPVFGGADHSLTIIRMGNLPSASSNSCLASELRALDFPISPLKNEQD